MQTLLASVVLALHATAPSVHRLAPAPPRFPPLRLVASTTKPEETGEDVTFPTEASAVVQAHHAAATAAIDAIGPPPSDVGVFMGGGFGGAAARRAAGA